MKSKYTVRELKEIANNSILLEKEVDFSYGRILSTMEKENIYPPLDSLLSMQNMFGLPFILKNYSLDEIQLLKLKERYNKNRVKEFNENHLKIEPHLIKDFDLETNSLEQAFYYISNNINFKFTDFHDYDFFEKMLNNPGYNKENIYLYQDFIDFFAHCTVISLKKGIAPPVNENFIFFNDTLKFLGKKREKEYDLFIESEYFIEETIRNFGESSSLLLSNKDIPKYVISYGLSKPLVLSSLKKAFKRAVRQKLDDSELKFIFSIGYVDSFGASSVSDHLTYLDKKTLKDTFDNMVPFSWSDEDVKTPFVDNLIDNYLFDNGNYSLLNADFKFPYREENYDLIFNNKRIEKILKKFQKKVPTRNHMGFLFSDSDYENEEYFIAKTYLKVFKFAAESNVSIFSNKDLVIPFSSLFFLNEFKKDTPLLDIIKSTPEFLRFEYGKDLFSGWFKGFMVINSVENDFLKNKLRKFLSNPTVDNVLILANADNNIFHDDVISMVAKLNPYDVNILKNILPLDFNLIGIEGDLNTPISTKENSPYMRKSAFSVGAKKSIEMMLNSNPDNINSLLEHLLSKDERILSSDAIFEYIFNNVYNQQDLNKWEIFLISYVQRFPDFIISEEDQEKYLRLIPNFAKSINLPIEIKTFDERIELFLSNGGSKYWKNISNFEKNVFLDEMSSNYRRYSKQDLDFMEQHHRNSYAKKLFYRDIEAFKKDEVLHHAFFNILNGLYTEELSYLTSKEHIRFIFDGFKKGRSPFVELVIPHKLKSAYKGLMMEEFPELVSHKDIVRNLNLSEEEKKELYRDMMSKDLHEVNFDCLIYFANSDRKDEILLSNDLIDVVNSLPRHKQLIWMVVLSHCFTMPSMDEAVIAVIEKNNLKEDGFHLVSYNTSLMFMIPNLHNVNEILSDKEIVNTYNSFTSSPLRKNLLGYSAKMEVSYKVNGILKTFNLNLKEKINNKINSDKIETALKENDFKAINSLFHINNKLRLNIVDENIQNLFLFLKGDDNVSNNFIDFIANNIKESILSNTLSSDNMENLIYASNIADSSSKKKNSFGFTNLEFRLYSNLIFKDALELYINKNIIEDVFEQKFNGFDEDDSLENNNVFKI